MRLLCWIGIHNYQKKWPGFFWKCHRCGRLQGWWERIQHGVTAHKAQEESNGK